MNQFIFCTLYIFSSLLAVSGFAQTKVYTGKINDKFEIEMHLRSDAKGLYGYYFYKSKKIPIAIHAEEKGHQVKLLEGSDEDAGIFFDGTIENKTFSGNWENTGMQKKLPFSLTEVSTDELDQTKAKNSGSFGVDNQNFSKDLKIVFINNTYFYFDISAASASGCTGNLIGIAESQSPEKGMFTSTDCKLLFKIKPKLINVTETNCNELHGAACNFDGNYPLSK